MVFFFYSKAHLPIHIHVRNAGNKVMKIEKIWFDDENIFVQTDEGFTIGNPLKWFDRLYRTAPEQRMNFEIGKFKDDIHWPEIDEDLTLESFFDFKRELNYAKI